MYSPVRIWKMNLKWSSSYETMTIKPMSGEADDFHGKIKLKCGMCTAWPELAPYKYDNSL